MFKKRLFIILSVFAILIIFMGSVCAADRNDTILSQDTDEIFTGDVSSAGNESGLKELKSDNQNLSLNSNNLLGASNDEQILGATVEDSETKEIINLDKVKLRFILPNGAEIDAICDAEGVWCANVTFTETGNFTITAKVVPENFTVNDKDYTFDRVIVGSVNVKDADYPIDVSVNPGNPGENTTVTVPDDVTGVVTVNVNGTDYPTTKVNDTTYVANIPLPAGNYTASGAVSDDPKYADKTSDDEDFEVAKVDDYSIGIDVDPGEPGENTTVTVTVPEDFTGNVTVTVNDTDYPAKKVNNTTYVADIPNLPVGNYTANATLTDDPKYEDKTSDNEDFEVEPLSDLEISITVKPSKAEYGDVVEFVVTVHNKGPSDASDVNVDISIPDGCVCLG